MHLNNKNQMWFYLFSVLNICSVQALTVLRHDLIDLNNAGVKNEVSSDTAAHANSLRQINKSEVSKAQEAHFRAWSLHQYQVLKREIDLLKGEGKEPSDEIILKFKPLEKIALTSHYATIAELPDIKRIREEHLNIWHQIQQKEEDQIKKGIETSNEELTIKIKPLAIQNDSIKINIDQFPTLNQFNIRNGLNVVKVGQSEAQFAHQNENNSEIVRKETFDSNARNTKDNYKNTIKPRLEIIKLDSIIPKINTEISQASRQLIHSEEMDKLNDATIQNSFKETSNQIKAQQFLGKDEMIVSFDSVENQNLKSTSHDNSLQTQRLQMFDKPEIIKSHDQQSNLLMEAQKQIYNPKHVHSDIEKLISEAPTVYVPKYVLDMVKVSRARDEHLKIVNEAILKAKLAQTQQIQKEIPTKQPEFTPMTQIM